MSELRIMEFNGKYRIEQGRVKGDKWYAERCMKKEWNKEKEVYEYTDREGNLSIQLGDKPLAENKLLQLLTDLTGKTYIEKDVPF